MVSLCVIFVFSMIDYWILRMLLSDKIGRKIVLVPFLVVLLFSITDFGLYLNRYIFTAVFLFFLSLFFLSLHNNQRVSLAIIFYALVIVFLFLLNHFFSSHYNGLLMIPIVSFIVFYSLRSRCLNLKKLLDFSIKSFLIFILLVSIFEIFVKLTGSDLFNYSAFIKDYGDRRFDVLRVRALFGSSLSTAALSIFFIIYFLLFSRSNTFILLSLSIILLSGSRTAIVVLLFMLICLFLKSVCQGYLSKSSILMVGIAFLSIVMIVVFTPIGNIALRSLSISMDDSFTGRSSTTILTLLDLLDQIPYSLFIGLQTSWISDSAITSIMASSGILSFTLFIALWIYLLLNTQLSLYFKVVTLFAFILGATMIGDFFVPVVSFLYFLTFLIYGRIKVADYE